MFDVVLGAIWSINGNPSKQVQNGDFMRDSV